MATNRFQDKFSPSKIGTGRLHIAGKLGTGKPGERCKRRGLAGALRKFRSEGKYTYGKNLSDKALVVAHRILGKLMRRLQPHSKGLSRRDRLEGKTETRKEWKEGHISKADKDDMDNMIDALGANIKPKPSLATHGTTQKRRAVRFATDDTARRGVRPKPSLATHGATQKRRAVRFTTDDTAPTPATKGRREKPPTNPLTVKKNHKKTSEQPLQPITEQEKIEEDIIAKRENIKSKDDNKVVELDIG